ncbi:MAG: hypothetical protein Q9207_006752 [Kuettlingeria erythrocarpa]
MPTLAAACSSFDGADDTEFDRLTPAVSSNKKRRQSAKKSTPRLPTQRNTITQMYSHLEQLFPNRDAEELEEDHIPVVDTPMPRTRRRRSSHNPVVSSVQTRSSKRKAAAAGCKSEPVERSNPPARSAPSAARGTDTTILEQRNTQMQPPATPKRAKRKFVPSSQSPAETPLSTHGKRRRHEGCHDITPLQELSVNTPSRNRFASRRKPVKWAPKLEIADSTNTANENTRDPFSLIIPGDPVKIKNKRPTLPLTVGRSPITRINPLKASKPSSSALNRSTLKRKETIADSQDEDIRSPSQSPARTGINETQKLYSTPSSAGENDDTAISVLRDHLEKDIEETADSLQGRTPQDSSYETIPTQLIVQPPPTTSPTTSPTHSSAPIHRALYQLSPRPSAFADASLQLEPELLLSSSPAPSSEARRPVLETESQFENAWREFTPPPPPLLSSSPAGLVAEPEAGAGTEAGAGAGAKAEARTRARAEAEAERSNSPTLPPLPNLRPSNPSTVLPVSASQATTTDITQPTPHRTRLHGPESQLLISSPIAQIVRSNSSPLLQRVQTLSSSSASSPLQARKVPAAAAGETFMGYEGWNGVPMRDSQLLPQSLLQDSLGLLARFGREEELELEEEEDDGRGV